MENNEITYNKTPLKTAGYARSTDLDFLIARVQNEKTKNYIATRLVQQMEWYSHKAGECQKKYHFWTAITIFLGALIPVVSVFADGSIWMKALIVALGSIVTACNAYNTMYNYKDLWITYRSMRERLLRTVYFYFYNTGVFAQESTQDAKDLLLVNICENEIANENNEWMFSKGNSK